MCNMVFKTFKFIATFFVHYCKEYFKSEKWILEIFWNLVFIKNFCWRDQDLGMPVNPEVDCTVAFM